MTPVYVSPQAMLGMPRTVGLDLSADRIDMEQQLPALLVAEVDSLAGPELAFEEGQSRYLCLSADNRRAPIYSSAECLRTAKRASHCDPLPAQPECTQGCCPSCELHNGQAIPIWAALLPEVPFQVRRHWVMCIRGDWCGLVRYAG